MKEGLEASGPQNHKETGLKPKVGSNFIAELQARYRSSHFAEGGKYFGYLDHDVHNEELLELRRIKRREDQRLQQMKDVFDIARLVDQ